MARVNADLASPRGMTTAAAYSRRRLFHPAFVLCLAAFIVVSLVGAWALSQNNPSNQIAQILQNPNAQSRAIVGTKNAPRARGELVALPGDNRAVLQISGLEPLPEDEMYEFWLIRGAQPVSAGLFQVSEDGTAKFLVTAAESINDFDKLGVTIERSAGEQTPRGTLVMEYGF